MPADRTSLLQSAGTAQRFTEAIASGQPLSSVGAHHPPSLERGKACLTCRRRRVKCDGARPVCGRCAKSARAHGESPDSFECVYDAGKTKVTPPASSSTAGHGAGDAATLQSLAAQVAALKQQLREQQQRQQQQSETPDPSPPQLFDNTAAHAVASTSSLTLEGTPSFSFTPAHNGGPGTGNSGGAGFTPPDQAWDANLSSALGGGTAALEWPLGSTGPDLSDLAAAASSTPLFQTQLPSPTSASMFGALLPSAYPSDLPSPALFHRLLNVFFTKSHLVSGMVSERRFRHSLTFMTSLSSAGSADPRAPAPVLLHAIVATAAMLVPESFYADEPRYWLLNPLPDPLNSACFPGGLSSTGGSDPLGAHNHADQGPTTLASYHAKLAQSLLDASFQRGHQLLHVVQAAVLCCFCMYTEARFGDIWLVCGMTSRLAITVGLNHVRASGGGGAARGDDDRDERDGGEFDPHTTRPGLRRAQRRLREKSMLAPTNDPEELAERAATFYMAMMTDRMSAAATGWAAAIDEDDITTLLPHPLGGPDTSDDPLTSPLYLHNPSFFFANPPHLTTMQQVYIKAFILLGRVVRFLQRAPEPVGSGWPKEPPEDLRETHGFRSLERTISHFRLSIPREYAYQYYSHAGPVGAPIENISFLVHSVLHVVTILMHEPFCLAADVDASQPSFVKCLDAAKAIVASVYELAGSSFEIGKLASFLNYLWAVAGRTLVRALALASRRNDLPAAAQLATDVKALIGAMQANKSRVGAVTALNLQRLLLHPFQILAESYSGPGPADNGPLGPFESHDETWPTPIVRPWLHRDHEERAQQDTNPVDEAEGRRAIWEILEGVQRSYGTGAVLETAQVAMGGLEGIVGADELAELTRSLGSTS